MNKAVSIIENDTINQRLGNGRMRFNTDRHVKKTRAWVFKKDISADSYITKIHPGDDWQRKIRDNIFVKYERQAFTPIKIGDKTYSLHNDLSHLATHINEAKELLNYQTDWDEDGSLATNEVVFNNAISFLVSYANFIYQNYSNTVLSVPYIDITREGGISIFWESAKAKFLIIFKNSDSKTAFFFGEKTDTKIPFKSAIEINGSVDESIASWMKTNLS